MACPLDYNINSTDSEPVELYNNDDYKDDNDDILESLLSKKIDMQDDIIDKIQTKYTALNFKELESISIIPPPKIIIMTTKKGKQYKAKICSLCGGRYTCDSKGNHYKTQKHKNAEIMVDRFVNYIRP